jgi:RimJ/RimL family protein N-acetyltransferase
VIVTERLRLIPATAPLLQAAIAGRDPLAKALRVTVPETWPPRFLDRQALEYVVDRLTETPAQAGWWMYFMLLPGNGAQGTLIGTAGYKGPVSSDGSVEVGYGIVSDHQRRGYATEAVRGLLAHAFAVPQVSRVIAETLPELLPSIGVLRKCGFTRTEGGSEPGVIRFALTREEYGARGGTLAAL